ncbi:MAG: hypothetical protein WA655_18095, partial [Candidatus Korobacteraceae bacterium]
TVMNKAREPDKILYTRLRWEDPELLFRVIEERYEVSHDKSPGSEMWGKYFCESVGGVPVKDYVVSKILPRPRDIVYLVKAAVSNAVNRRHSKVEEEDIRDAEPSYSQYAIKSILVENGISMPELESVIYEFVGGTAILSEEEVLRNIRQGLKDSAKETYALQHLIGLTFLGLEVRPGDFLFAEDPDEFRKNSVLASKLRNQRQGLQRFKVNPAFHAYLEVHDQGNSLASG